MTAEIDEVKIALVITNLVENAIKYNKENGWVARYQANILTIHQSIPINGVATLTLSVEVLQTTKNLSEMVEEIEQHSGVHYLKIVGRE